jgi:hypothetical protein
MATISPKHKQEESALDDEWRAAILRAEQLEEASKALCASNKRLAKELQWRDELDASQPASVKEVRRQLRETRAERDALQKSEARVRAKLAQAETALANVKKTPGIPSATERERMLLTMNKELGNRVLALRASLNKLASWLDDDDDFMRWQGFDMHYDDDRKAYHEQRAQQRQQSQSEK